MVGIFNRLAHVAVGAWVGSGVNDARFRHGSYVAATAFMAYQALEAWRKGDTGYGELREFGVGLFLPLAYRRLKEWGNESES